MKFAGAQGVEERPCAGQITKAHKSAFVRLPQDKAEVSVQFGQRFDAKLRDEMKDELFVGGRGGGGDAELVELAAEVVAAIEADVTDEPSAAVDGAGLLRGLRGGSGAEKGEDEAGAGLRGDVRGVGAAESEMRGHAIE